MRKCLLPTFSSFPTILSKGFFLRVVKLRIVWQRVEHLCRFVIEVHLFRKITIISKSLNRRSYEIGSWKSSVLSSHGLIRIKRHVDPLPNKHWFLRLCSTSLLKTLWKKEKLLVTNNFSLSHSVFYPFEELSAIFI